MRIPARVLFALVALWITTACASARPPLEWEGHFIVYVTLGDAEPVPVGSETRRYYPAEYQGEPAQAFESSGEIRLRLMGTEMTIVEEALSYTSLEGDPLYLEAGMGGDLEGAQRTIATYHPDRVDYVRRAGGEESRGSCIIPEGVSLRDPDYLFGPEAMPTGEPVTLHAFEPFSLEIQPVTMTNEGSERAEVAGRSVEGWRLEVDSEMLGPSTNWVDDEGLILGTRYTVGELVFEIVRVPAEDAVQFESGELPGLAESPDLIGGTAVRVDTSIPRPRQCRELTVRVTGVDRERLLIDDRRQDYGPVEETPDGGLAARLTIRAPGPPGERPALGEAPPDDVAVFLESTATIQSDDPRFIALAEEIVGDESDPWVAAWSIAEWVDATMAADLNEPLLRSALEVLEDPSGACRSYAALYCGVARAAGIPCRVAVGAVYAPEALGTSAFAFHAWNEVWVGEWVAIDATLAVPGYPQPADATHIKFTQGDVRAFAPAARVIRSLDLEVLDADTLGEAEEGAEAKQGEVVTQ